MRLLRLFRNNRDAERAEVLVEDSWFAWSDLPKILGNFMRSNRELSAESKALYLRLQRAREVLDRWNEVVGYTADTKFRTELNAALACPSQSGDTPPEPTP